VIIPMTHKNEASSRFEFFEVSKLAIKIGGRRPGIERFKPGKF